MNYDGKYVLYWMTTARRTRFNHALDRAVSWARSLDIPLVVVEALGLNHRWASARFHQFIIEGMENNAAAFAEAGIQYIPFLEKSPGDSKGFVEAASQEAALIVTDEWPCFITPKIVAGLERNLLFMLKQSMERVCFR